VLQFVNGELTIAANTGSEPVPMPQGELLMSSVDLPGDGTLPPDTTVWLLTEVFNEAQS
jgi:alpha-glucosidase